MAGVLSRARGPDRDVSVEKPGSPAPGFFFWCSRAFTGPLPISDQIEERREPDHEFLTYLGSLSDAAVVGILWAFAEDPRDLAAVA